MHFSLSFAFIFVWSLLNIQIIYISRRRVSPQDILPCWTSRRSDTNQINVRSPSHGAWNPDHFASSLLVLQLNLTERVSVLRSSHANPPTPCHRQASGTDWLPTLKSISSTPNLTRVSSMWRHDGTSNNIFRPNLSEVHSGLWHLHVCSTSMCLLEILKGFTHAWSHLFLPFESRGTLCFVSCPPNHLEGELWMTDCNAKWVWLFNDNAVIRGHFSWSLKGNPYWIKIYDPVCANT